MPFLKFSFISWSKTIILLTYLEIQKFFLFFLHNSYILFLSVSPLQISGVSQDFHLQESIFFGIYKCNNIPESTKGGKL